MNARRDSKEQYLERLIAWCEQYDTFHIPAAKLVGMNGVTLSDIYTNLPLMLKKPNQETFKKSGQITTLGNLDIAESFHYPDTSRRLAHLNYILLSREAAKNLREQMPQTFSVWIGKKTKRAGKEFRIGIQEEKDVEEGKSVLKPILLYSAEQILNQLKEGHTYDLKGVQLKEKDTEYIYIDPASVDPSYECLYMSPTRQGAELSDFLLNEDEARGYVDAYVIQSEPGGGKTTLLKWWTRALAMGLHEELPGFIKDRDDCAAFLPVMIKIRDMEMQTVVDFDVPLTKADIEQILIKSISTCGSNYQINSDHSRLVLLIDGYEEFSSNERGENFLYGLVDFYKTHKDVLYILSTRQREFENIKRRQSPVLFSFLFEEYVIADLAEHPNVVKAFAEKWYHVLNSYSESRDVETEFLEPISKNQNVRNLISNPLELTSLLMISTFDNCLPSDMNQVFERSVELWLSWANQSQYHIRDTKMQLAKVAYEMAVSGKNTLIISEEDLILSIREMRKTFARYFVRKQGMDRDSILSFIHYVSRSGILRLVGNDQYEFNHRQYQAYLCAFCIKENYFSKEERKRERIEYLTPYLLSMDPYWEQIIVLVAMQDISLRDEVIEELLSLSKANPEENYFLAILLQLIMLPGFNFEGQERRRIYDMLLLNEKRLKLFSSRAEEFRQLFMNNTEEENLEFLETVIEKYEEATDENHKRSILDCTSEMVFFTIWTCQAPLYVAENVLRLWFPNSIYEHTASIVKRSYEKGTYKPEVVALVRRMGAEALLQGKRNPDYHLLLAIVAIYESGKDPYQTVFDLYETGHYENAVLATHILLFASWEETRDGIFLNSMRKKRIPDQLAPKIYPFLSAGITDADYKDVFWIYAYAYKDLAEAGMTGEEMFTKEAFLALCEHVKTESALDNDEYCLAHAALATFPLNDMFLSLGRENKATLRDESVTVSWQKLEKRRGKYQTFYAFKLLCLFDHIPESERLDVFMKKSREQIIDAWLSHKTWFWDDIIIHLTKSDKEDADTRLKVCKHYRDMLNPFRQ